MGRIREQKECNTYRQIKYISILFNFYTLCIMNKISDKVMQEKEKKRKKSKLLREEDTTMSSESPKTIQKTAVFLIPPPF